MSRYDVAEYYDENMNLIDTQDMITTFLNIPSVPFINNWTGGDDSIAPIYLGADFQQKTITATVEILARDYLDYESLRNKLYDIFGFNKVLYIVDKRQPSKRHKVVLESNFMPERRNFRSGTVNISFITKELPYAESIITTDDLDTSNQLIGYADVSDPVIIARWVSVADTVIHSTPVQLSGYDKYFMRVSAPPAEIGENRRFRTRYDIHLVEGKKYELSFIGTTSGSLNPLDPSFNYTGILRTNGLFARKLDLNRELVGEAIIDGEDTPIYSYTQEYTHEYETGNYALMIGTKQRAELKGDMFITEPVLKGIDVEGELYMYEVNPNNSTFRIRNHGNVPIHPFEQDLKITIFDSGALPSQRLVIENVTNGSKFELTEQLRPDDTVTLDGANVTRNGLPFFRSTNKQFITLEPGWNDFEVAGVSRATIRFEFRFYYRG